MAAEPEAAGADTADAEAAAVLDEDDVLLELQALSRAAAATREAVTTDRLRDGVMPRETTP